jgi:hypothetical protein
VQTPSVSGAGDAPKVTNSLVVAVYDKGSGGVVHVHTVHVHEGAREVSEAEAAEQARRHANTLGHDTERYGIAVSTDPAHGRHPHRIDPATGAFEPIRLPESGSSARSAG